MTGSLVMQQLTLLGTAEQRSIFLQAKVHFDEVGACQELHDHAAA